MQVWVRIAGVGKDCGLDQGQDQGNKPGLVMGIGLEG